MLFIVLPILAIAALLLYRIYFVGALPAAANSEILATNTKSTNIFHQLLVNPAMLDDFKHDAVLLCFEKVNRRRLIVKNGQPGYYSVDDQYASFAIDRELGTMQNKGLGGACNLVKRTLNDPKPMVLTHWIETTPALHNIRYNAYDAIKGVDYDLPKQALEQYEAVASWVKHKLQSEKYTHLLVACSGWNNYQNESRDLYDNWIKFTRQAAAQDGREAEFRPLLIGFTWASRWITPGLSYFNKANDADELGMTHISRLLFRYVMPAMGINTIPVVTIGHSFGARIMSRANHSRFMQRGVDASAWIEKAIEFQGAYPATRFCENTGNNGGLYTVDVPVKKHFMTCSVFDNAIKSPVWSKGFIGDNRAINLLQDNPIARKNFEFTSLDTEGRFTSLQNTHPKILVDAKEIISKMESKAAGAHNDVCDKEAGRFIWEILKSS